MPSILWAMIILVGRAWCAPSVVGGKFGSYFSDTKKSVRLVVVMVGSKMLLCSATLRDDEDERSYAESARNSCPW